MFNLPCVIFAGGRSSRMGEDKALLPFGGFDTLTQFQLSRLKPLFSSIYISCKDSSKFFFEANFIEDMDSSFAPAVAIDAVFGKLGCERFFAISVDTPFVDKTIVSKLYESDDLCHDAVVASVDGTLEPLCTIYHNAIRVKVQRAMAEQNYKLALLLSDALLVEFEPSEQFLNMNRPQDYQKALLQLEAMNEA